MSASAQRFEELRPRLLRMAYSQLASVAEAEDVVQEAWLRLHRTGETTIDNLPAWLTTVSAGSRLTRWAPRKRAGSATSGRGYPTRSSRRSTKPIPLTG